MVKSRRQVTYETNEQHRGKKGHTNLLCTVCWGPCPFTIPPPERVDARRTWI